VLRNLYVEGGGAIDRKEENVHGRALDADLLLKQPADDGCETEGENLVGLLRLRETEVDSLAALPDASNERGGRNRRREGEGPTEPEALLRPLTVDPSGECRP
jgi:hypothetical protein